MEAGNSKTLRKIPIHALAALHGVDLCSVLPAVHHLTGSDYTSKVGMKLSALHANPANYLSKFGHGNLLILLISVSSR